MKNDAQTTIKFLYEYVFTRYGLPIDIMSDQGVHFINEVIEFLLEEFMVIHRRSTPYYPQANGQERVLIKRSYCFDKSSRGNMHGLGSKIAFYPMGLLNDIQNSHRYYSFQSSLWIECDSPHRVSDTDSTSCKANGVDKS